MALSPSNSSSLEQLAFEGVKEPKRHTWHTYAVILVFTCHLEFVPTPHYCPAFVFTHCMLLSLAVLVSSLPTHTHTVWMAGGGLKCCRHWAARQSYNCIHSTYTKAVLPSHTSVSRVAKLLPTCRIWTNIRAFTLDWNHMLARHVHISGLLLFAVIAR